MTDPGDVSRTSRFTGKTAKSLNEAAAVHRIPRPPRIAGWPAYKGNRIKASGGPMTRTPSVLVLSVLVLGLGAKRLGPKRLGPVFVCCSDVLDFGWAGRGFYLALGNIH